MNTSEIFKQTKKIIFDNMIQEYSDSMDFEYCYTRPSRSVYPFQYFWDTCFHVFILCSIGELKHAKMHLRSLFSLQEENGFVGNIIYWNNFFPARTTDIFQFKPKTLLKLNQPHMSGIIQPTFAAQALLRIYEETKDTQFVKELLPKLKKYFNWLHNNRDFDGDGLISIISTFESGMDWKPTFDPVLRFSKQKADYKLFLKVISVDLKNFLRNYNLETIHRKNAFIVKDAGFNSIYAKDLEALVQLCDITNDYDSITFLQRAKKVTQSILNILYDEKDEAFYDVFGYENRKLEIVTPTIFFPLTLPGIPKEISRRVIKRHIYETDHFKVNFPLPSLSKDAPAFNPDQSIYIWRGPTWIFHNWFLHTRLPAEHKTFKNKLLQSSLELLLKSGFREYYNPFTGKGLGARGFTWAGLVTDMLVSERKNNKHFSVSE